MSDALREMVEKEMRDAIGPIPAVGAAWMEWISGRAVDVAVRLVRQAKTNAAEAVTANMCPEDRPCECCDRMDSIAAELTAPPSAGEGEETT